MYVENCNTDTSTVSVILAADVHNYSIIIFNGCNEVLQLEFHELSQFSHQNLHFSGSSSEVGEDN